MPVSGVWLAENQMAHYSPVWAKSLFFRGAVKFLLNKITLVTLKIFFGFS
jgi:hypothetical protein